MNVDLTGLLVAVVAGGFTGLITVIGFFARRLVATQDKHAEKLGEHDTRIVRVEADVRHLRREAR